MPDALRTTFPPATIWSRTAEGKTLCTVSARGLPARGEDSPSSGEARRKRPATRAAPPRLERSR
jgi:hypothetical protein